MLILDQRIAHSILLTFRIAEALSSLIFLKPQAKVKGQRAFEHKATRNLLLLLAIFGEMSCLESCALCFSNVVLFDIYSTFSVVISLFCVLVIE